MAVILSLLPLVLVIIALVDIITREEWQVKHLPKFVWILLVILIPLVGSIVWFAVGREYSGSGGSSLGADPGSSSSSSSGIGSGPSRPSRWSPASRSTEDELAALDAEIAYFENQERIRRLEAELEARRKGSGDAK